MGDVKVEDAAKELSLSKFTIYRLPKGTPGVYRYGRALRVNVEELRAWAKGQAYGRKNEITSTREDQGGLGKSSRGDEK